jgi:hypothetical protein
MGTHAHDDSVQVIWSEIDYTFGEPVTISAKFSNTAKITTAALHYLSPGKSLQIIAFDFPDSSQIELTIREPEKTLSLFTTVYYWFEFTAESGQTTISPAFYFDYQDTRFTWQTDESQNVVISWYEGDVKFGEKASATSEQSLLRLETLLPVVPLDTPFEIYIYEDQQTMLSALGTDIPSHIDGYSTPELGMAFVSISPGADAVMEMERQIPHEITHLMLYQINPHGYEKLPIWLVEGLASQNELYPSSDYASALQEAWEDDSLISLATLCSRFPQNPHETQLAYAQSSAFVGYLHDRFGRSGITDLMNQYYDEKGCSEALEAAFGASLSDLESEWQSAYFSGAAAETPEPINMKAAGLLCASILLPIIFVGSYLWIRSKTMKKVISHD